MSGATIQNPLQGLTEEQLRILQIFHPYAVRKIGEIIKNGTRFIHYTTAEGAVGILDSKEVWMRKSSCMNDYMEVEHGFECLNAAYKKHKEKFSAIFDAVFPGFSKKLEELFNGWLPQFRSESYITCISEHDEKENRTGRLSMWRAYGSAAGVGVVLNPAPFIQPSDALKAYTSPVAYLDGVAFEREYTNLLESFEANIAILQQMGEDAVRAYVFEVFRMAILCTKHPGFSEEREWRVIYTPTYQKSDRILSDVRSIRGIPQPIYRIPLKDIPEEGLVGIEIPTLVNDIIIGPTQFPLAIRDAFVSKLSKAGVVDALKRIVISDIPLRI
jgi:hypothetical protein